LTSGVALGRIFMKKEISWILLFITALKIGGFLAILSVEREIVRSGMKEKIAKSIDINSLTCIIGTPQNLSKIEWEEENKEFWLENELYDIVKTQKHNDLIYYYCLSDIKEKEVLAKIETLTNSQKTQNPVSNTTKELLTIILQPTTCNHFSYDFNNIDFKVTNKFKSITTLYHYLPILKLLEPPQLKFLVNFCILFNTVNCIEKNLI
jgi:hypothetical protein